MLNVERSLTVDVNVNVHNVHSERSYGRYELFRNRNSISIKKRTFEDLNCSFKNIVGLKTSFLLTTTEDLFLKEI